MKDLGIGHIRLKDQLQTDSYTFSHSYQPAQGIAPLVETISLYENTSPENILVSTGASLGLVCSLCLLPKNSTVLCPYPYYPAYPSILKNLGLQAMFYHLDKESGEIPVGEIISKNIPSLSAILLNTPGNPAGNLIGQDDLDRIISFAESNNIKILSDEVYAPFVYGETYSSCIPHIIRKNIIVVKSFSKIFMMPGERIGYVIAAPELISSLTRIHWALAMSAPAYGQYKSTQLLTKDSTKLTSSLIIELKKNRHIADSILRKSERISYRTPEAGIFYWLKIKKSKSEMEAFHDQLAERNISVMPGILFGEEFYNYIRINIAIEKKELEESLYEILSILQ